MGGAVVKRRKGRLVGACEKRPGSGWSGRWPSGCCLPPSPRGCRRLDSRGGWLFADTYRQSRSLWLVCLEHALYGDLIFTIGLGTFFYHGAVR